MSALSFEERRKVLEEEKLRMELRKKMEAESRPKPGLYIALIGSVVWVLGVFLPWVQIGIISASGFQKLGTDGYLHFVFAGGVFLASITSLIQKDDNAILIVIFSLLGGGLTLYHYIQLSDNISGVAVFNATAQIGAGFYLTATGILVSFIGGAMLAEKKKKNKKQ